MPPKANILNYFGKPRPMQNLTNLDAPEQGKKPLGKVTLKNDRQESCTPSSLQKRKAGVAITHTTRKNDKRLKLHGEEKGGSDRKEKLREHLGEGSVHEQNFRAVQDKFNWLESKVMRDACGRRPGDKEYDPRTVLVPSGVWPKLSASQKQYWETKHKYRDVILFFKIGSFYELYEEDAQIGHDVLGWKLTLTGVGACRQVGCPASGLEEAIARLTAAGYKVGQMEQTETAAEAKAKRGPKACITRTLMRIHSPATATASVSADAVTLLAIFEREDEFGHGTVSNTQSTNARFGFAFLDAAASRYFVGSIADDAGRANLSAILTQVAPKEVIFVRNGLSTTTTRNLATPPVPLQLSPTDRSDFAEEVLAPFQGTWPLPPCTKKELFGQLQLPNSLQTLGVDSLGALAALVKHLRRLNAECELVTNAQLVVPYEQYEGALRLDGPTLQNLELLETQDGGAKGSLLSYLDTCASAGGRRLLRVWLCRPLCNVQSINDRLDAVEELSRRPEVVGEFRSKVRQVTDLERLLGRVRNANQPPVSGLPDWAIRAGQATRLSALAAAVEGVRAACNALKALAEPTDGAPISSSLLQSSFKAIPTNTAVLEEISDALEIPASFPKSAKKAKGKEGTGKGVCLSASSVDRLAEGLPLGGLSPEEYQLQKEIKATTVLIRKFNASGPQWEALETEVSTVDVLCSFATFTATSDGPTSRPQFVEAEDEGGPVFDMKSLWHPCAVAGAASSIVPNDLSLGNQDDAARSLLLTGPNMGGKSTILRATCCATIMAQMGCWVPAAAAVLSPADRIFTRLGAHDRILAGESTFLVECNEASAILRHATSSSLVVLDELGRGTSTFDGYAIAHAVLNYLSSKVGCRLLFATHYHPLTSEFASCDQVKLGYMAASVASSSQVESGMPSITFLYRLCSGACPKSYGLQVAQLAGIPSNALRVADQAGLQLETKLKALFEGSQHRGNRLDETEEAAFKRAVTTLRSVCRMQR